MLGKCGFPSIVKLPSWSCDALKAKYFYATMGAKSVRKRSNELFLAQMWAAGGASRSRIVKGWVEMLVFWGYWVPRSEQALVWPSTQVSDFPQIWTVWLCSKYLPSTCRTKAEAVGVWSSTLFYLAIKALISLALFWPQTKFHASLFLS